MKYKKTDLSEEAILQNGLLSRLFEPNSRYWDIPMPEHLWQYGEIPNADYSRKVVAIVGSRNCTKYGAEIAYKTAKRLAEYGVVVVSGMAYGIDTYAHRGCLDGGGRTVAVLGTPIDRLYPASNENLAVEIVKKGGAILSEHPPGTQSYKQHFYLRNRIVSALADYVLVVEATEKSGTKHTIDFANNQGRVVWAVPGDLTRASSRGCNLANLDGAVVFTSIDHFMDSVYPSWRILRPSQEKKKYSKLAESILEALRQEPMLVDSLCELTNQPVDKILSCMGLLEAEGLISQDNQGIWGLV